jgi:hypothetical protein
VMISVTRFMTMALAASIIPSAWRVATSPAGLPSEFRVGPSREL